MRDHGLLSLAGIAALAVVSTAGCSGPPGPEPGSIVRPGLGARIDDYLGRLSGFGYSGAILVSRDGRIVLCRGYGFANDSTHTPVVPATVFDIGSLAKQFTAAAVLVLESRGRLSVDDTLSRFLDGVPADKRAITLRQLLTHTSGLGEDFPFENPSGEYYEEVDRETAVQRILGMPLVASPGTIWSYSNPGFVLLAAIVERASGVPFRDFVRTELFEPAGMHSTGFWGDSLPGVPDSLFARSYDEKGQTADLRLRSATTWCDLGGGEVVSTVTDLLAWIDALRNERILPADARDRMWTAGPGKTGFAWFVDSTAHGTLRIHEGGDNVGFGAELACYPDDGVVMIHLANRRRDVLGTRYAADRVVPRIVFGQTLEMWPGEPFDPPPAWEPVSAGELVRIPGVYRLPTGGTFVMTAGEGVLHVAASGQDAVEALVPAPDSAHASWRVASDRVLAMIRSVGEGDTTLLVSTLREGAPLDVYRHVIRSAILQSPEGGALQAAIPVGTIPSALPRNGLHTMLHLRFEHGEDLIRFGWVKERIINIGGGLSTVASTPFRARPAGGFTGWNIIWAREVRMTPVLERGQVVGVRIGGPGGRPETAMRVPAE